MMDKKLLNGLSNLGFPMFESSKDLDVNETLSEVVKCQDTRLWEGFPVMLANASDSYQFSPELVNQLLTDNGQRVRFHQLLLLSLSLYAIYHLTFSWISKFKNSLSEVDREQIKGWRTSLVHNQPLTWGNVELDSERLKGLFDLYFEQSAEKSRRQSEKLAEFSLEYALSQVFSPKQKELFKKRLEGLPLTKTEKEYYSRTVKKKVIALANSELHNLSRKLLEQ